MKKGVKGLRHSWRVRFRDARSVARSLRRSGYSHKQIVLWVWRKYGLFCALMIMRTRSNGYYRDRIDYDKLL